MNESLAPDPSPVPRERGGFARVTALLNRFPWLLPAVSFFIGWLSFSLVQRGERLATWVAVIALLGWPWLLAENALERWIVARSKGRLSIGAVRFVTQQIEQEVMFFALPFLFAATQPVPGQILFLALAALVALLTTLDPIYFHRIAPHAGFSAALHAYCTFIAALVVLPIALHMPLDRALGVAMTITGISLLLSLPRMLRSTTFKPVKIAGIVALPFMIALVWVLRTWIPPAGLWVREKCITDRVENLEPGQPFDRISAADLQARGAAAFVAVRAPLGLSQSVWFEWRFKGVLVDRIPAEIAGGRETGFRTYSRKENFPENPQGQWTVDLRTPDRQLVATMRFEVE